MRFPLGFVVLNPILILILGTALLAQNAAELAPPSVTVPMTLDQGRVVIDVDLLFPNGSTERVRGWVDNGNPDLYMNQRIANLMGLSIRCDGQICIGAPPSREISLEIGGMKISLSQIKEKTGEIKVLANSPALAPGMSAEINIPSSVLRNYDVLFNFPGHEFTIGLPGRLKFEGVKNKMLVNPSNGLIQIPSKIENKNADLGLDLGSSTNFLSEELFNKLLDAHPNWPHMTGTVGPFNTGELDSEPKWRVMRVDRMQFGPLFLTDVAVAEPPNNPPNRLSLFAGHAGLTVAGLLGAEALINYRVGLDYAHSSVYFDIGRTTRFPDFDVVGIMLRPEGDTGFTIVGVADFEGSPSVPTGKDGIEVGDHLVAVNNNPVAELTLGQVWSLLEGSPGQERQLTIARAGKQFSLVATVQHFLGETSRNDDRMKSKKN